MNKFTLPAQVLEHITQLGQRIRLARIRRNLSVVNLAKKAGINRNTLNSLELGKPGTSISAIIATLWALGLDKTLDTVADPDMDTHGKVLEASRRPKRASKLKTVGNEYDF